MASGSSIGMMEGAFFVGRGELLSWVNDLLQINMNKVEQMASGAAYIQIMDAIFPNTVPMSKINWMAKYEHEFVNNYKILQQVFDKNLVQKHIEVQKLIKAKYQDNLQFMQWMKRYFDLNFRGGDYNALERRRNAKTPWDGSGRAVPTTQRSQARNTSNRAPAPSNRNNQPSRPKPPESSSPKANMNKEVAELRMMTDTLEKERDFYFGKLRAIELFCEYFHDPENEIITQIQRVLYATDDETVTVNEDGSLSINQV